MLEFKKEENNNALFVRERERERGLYITFVVWLGLLFGMFLPRLL